jgi:hypothetical protein
VVGETGEAEHRCGDNKFLSCISGVDWGQIIVRLLWLLQELALQLGNQVDLKNGVDDANRESVLQAVEERTFPLSKPDQPFLDAFRGVGDAGLEGRCNSLIVECTLTGEGGCRIGEHAGEEGGVPIGVGPVGDHEVVEEEELEGHLRDGVVDGVPESVEALGESFGLEHLSEDDEHFLELAGGVVGFALDELHLQSLQRVGGYLGEQHWQVDGQQFGEEVVGAEVEVDHKH